MSLLYKAEFEFIPFMFFSDTDAFFTNTFMRREEFFSELFNEYFDAHGYTTNFTKDDFEVKNFQYDSENVVIVVKLPETNFPEPIYCRAYFLPFTINEQFMSKGFFTLEKSSAGDFVSKLKKSGIHYNLNNISFDGDFGKVSDLIAEKVFV